MAARSFGRLKGALVLLGRTFRGVPGRASWALSVWDRLRSQLGRSIHEESGTT